MPRFVLTGGPCSGKTTLIQRLSQLGFSVLPESALIVINSGIEECGMKAFTLWRKANKFAFQSKVLEEQFRLESTISNDEVLVMDRSAVDCIAHLLDDPIGKEKLTDQIDIDHYKIDLVFLLDTLTDFDSRPLTGRTSTYSDSIESKDQLSQTYVELGYQPICIPEDSIENRVNIIVEHIKKWQSIQLETTDNST